MPTFERSPATTYEIVDRWNDGLSWIAHPDEDGERVSHALRADDSVWILDPLDAPGIDDEITELSEVVGVAVLSNYHA